MGKNRKSGTGTLPTMGEDVTGTTFDADRKPINTTLTVEGQTLEIEGKDGIHHTKEDVDKELSDSFVPNEVTRDLTPESIQQQLHDHIPYVYETYFNGTHGIFPDIDTFTKYVEENTLPQTYQQIEEAFNVLEERPDAYGIEYVTGLLFDEDNNAIEYI